MIKNAPDGARCVMLDAGYDAHENYKMIRDADRRSVLPVAVVSFHEEVDGLVHVRTISSNS